MSDTLLIILFGAGILAIFVVIFLRILRTSRQINLTDTPEDEKPEWLRSDPPPETIEETQADHEGISLYDFDQGEDIAAAFAEQIEDIIHTLMREDPELESLQLDLGTGPEGGIEYHFQGQAYAHLDQIPNERMRAVIKRAVEIYNSRE
ncbi:MAG: hypothetical protein R6U57_00320 [Anaerolineales bacterium]